MIAADCGGSDDAPGVWVRPRRVARCSWRLGQTVSVHHSDRGAHFSGTERCASIWGCPVCSSVIRAERAREIDTAFTAHKDAGGGFLFVTGTLRHKDGDPLALGLDAVMEGWRRLIRGAPWKRWAVRLGLVGFIRSIEVTTGDNGWHPHMHGVLLTSGNHSDQMVAAFTAWAADRWACIVTKLGARTPDVEHGFKVRAVREDGRVLASYLAKVQEQKIGGKVGAELARGDLKAARSSSSRMPFELLDTPDDSRDVALWLEYLAATAGRRCIQWSTGLRDLLELGEETTSEQIIADTDAAPIVAVLDGPVYDQLRRSGRDHLLLDQLELAAAAPDDPAGDLLHLLGPAPVLAGPEPEPLPAVAPGARGRQAGSRAVLRPAAALRAERSVAVVRLPYFDWAAFKREDAAALRRAQVAALHRINSAG